MPGCEAEVPSPLAFGAVAEPPAPKFPSSSMGVGSVPDALAGDATAGAAKATGEAPTEGTSGGPAGGAGKASAEEEVVGDQPPSSSTSGPGRYLKVGDDLFVHLPGASSRAPAEGEVFDGEVLAATGLEVVGEPGVGGDGSPEEQLFRAMGANFQKLQAHNRVRQVMVKSRTATMDQAEVDYNARVDETQTWFQQAREE